MKKIKVLFVSHFAGINGAPKSMVSIINELRKKGIYFLVVLPEHGALEDELVRYKIPYRIIRFKDCFYKETCEAGNVRRWLREIYNLKAVFQLTRMIKKYDFDIVHSNSYAVDVGAFAAYLAKKPHIWHFREFMKADFDFVHNIERKAKWLAKNSDRIIAVSEAVKEYYEKTKELENIEVIYNGIDQKIYRIDKKNPLAGDKLNILISGTVSAGKGQKEAVDACKILIDRGYKNFELSIVGNGDREYMRALKRDRNKCRLNKYIKFYGFQPDMIAVRKRMDVELVCSVCEAFGRVTIEAMMADMLVIGANTGGTKELIQDGVNGILYQQGDATDLADKLEMVLRKRQDYVPCIYNGKNMAMKKFDVRDMSRKIFHIYQEIV